MVCKMSVRLIFFLSFLIILLIVVFLRNGGNRILIDNLYYSDWDDVDVYIKELFTDCARKGIQLELTYESLLELETFIEEELQKAEPQLDKQYVFDHQRHFLAFIGETYIAEHGGRWLVKKDSNGEVLYFHGIRCVNGKVGGVFTKVFVDIIQELENREVYFFPLSAPYSSFKSECY